MPNRSREWLIEEFLTHDPYDYNSDLIDSLLPIGSTGNTFYVDPTNGADTNDGRSSDNAFATLQAGIDACTADNGDIVVRMPGGENPTAAITFDCQGITVVASTFGAAPVQGAEVAHYMYPAASYTTGPMAIITKPCAILGLEFVTRCTTSVAGGGTKSTVGSAIVFDGDLGTVNGGFSLIYGCRFVDWWGSPYGVTLWGGGYNRIQSCEFNGFDAGVAIYSGVYGPESNDIIDCRFRDNVNGIEHITGGSNPHNFLYKGNSFIDYTDAIDFNNKGADGLVCDNWYETATDAATYDITVAQAQALGINFSGNHYSE